MRMLKKFEERLGQYATKREAVQAARVATINTKRQCTAVRTVTYRDDEPVGCWTVTCNLKG